MVSLAECFASEPDLNVTKNLNTVMNAKCFGTDYAYKHEIVWKNAIGFLILHLLGLWGLAIFLTGGIMLKTFIWCK